MPIVKHIYWNGPCNRAKWSYDDKLKDGDADNHAVIRSVKLVLKARNSIENFCYAVHIGRPKNLESLDSFMFGLPTERCHPPERWTLFHSSAFMEMPSQTFPKSLSPG